MSSLSGAMLLLGLQGGPYARDSPMARSAGVYRKHVDCHGSLTYPFPALRNLSQVLTDSGWAVHLTSLSFSVSGVSCHFLLNSSILSYMFYLNCDYLLAINILVLCGGV